MDLLAGYGLAYGVELMNVYRNYNYPLGIDMSAITTQYFLELKFLHNGVIYTSYPKFTNWGYFYSEPTYFCPISAYIAENGIFTSNFAAQEGSCAIKFVYNKNIRAPMSVLYIGEPKLSF